MASRTCSACGGRGGVSETKWTRNTSQVGPTSIGTEVFTRCAVCGGTGQVWAPDSAAGTSPKPRLRTKSISAGLRTPQQTDKAFADLLTLLTGGVSLYLVFSSGWQAEAWVKLIFVAAITGTIAWVLRRNAQLVRWLRYATVAGIVIAVIVFFFHASHS